MKIRNNQLIFFSCFLITVNCIAQENPEILLDSKNLKSIKVNLYHRVPQTSIKQHQHRNELRIEGFIGFPYNLPSPLIIKQRGEPNINLTADFASKPFEVPIYWAWRISYWKNKRSWELEAIHHKIFLQNNPPEVQNFSISHGLNLIVINRGWQFPSFIFRAGGGIVLAHPESVVRNKKFPENRGIFKWGYYISGPVVNLSIAKDFKIINRFYVICEMKVDLSYASVPIYDGNAILFNTAFQLNFGFGYNFLKF